MIEPLQQDRRYRFSVLDRDEMGGYRGTDLFDGRVVEMFVRVEELPGGPARDIPLRDIFRADDKPCEHQNTDWSDKQGLYCAYCRMPMLPNVWHAWIRKGRDGFEVVMWDPNARENKPTRSFRQFKTAMQYAAMMTDPCLSVAVKGEL